MLLPAPVLLLLACTRLLTPDAAYLPSEWFEDTSFHHGAQESQVPQSLLKRFVA